MFVFGHAGLTVLGMAPLLSHVKQKTIWHRPGVLFSVAFLALLPDIIDKPMTFWVIPDPPSSRWIAHTLIFWIGAGALLWWYRRDKVLYVLAPMFHLVLDGMWQSPRTLLFPFLGLQMDHSTIYANSIWELISLNLRMTLSHWQDLVPELAGCTVLFYAVLQCILDIRNNRPGDYNSVGSGNEEQAR